MNSRNPEDIINGMKGGAPIPVATPYTPKVVPGALNNEPTPTVTQKVEQPVQAEEAEIKQVEAAETKPATKPTSKEVITRDENGKFQFHQKITTEVRDSKGFKRANIGLPKIVKFELDKFCLEQGLSWVEYSNIMCAYIVERGGVPEDFIKRYRKATQD